jgi:ATP-dependent Clp protease ATP-binding subunit ClpB
MAQIKDIVRLILKNLENRLEEQEMTLEADDTALEFIANAAYDPIFGARPLKRYVQKEVETKIGRHLIRGDFNPGDRLLLTVKDQSLQVTKAE